MTLEDVMRRAFPGYERFFVTWHVNVVNMIRAGKLSMGICARTNNVAFIAGSRDVLRPMIIRDVLTDKIMQTCEDARWCLDLSCSYNKADPKLIHVGARTMKEVENVHRRLEEWKTLAELKISEPSGALIVYKKPVVVFRRTRGEKEIMDKGLSVYGETKN